MSGPGTPTGERSPFLSVIVCAGNDAELVRQTLESLCIQTLAPDLVEVVLVDGASNDSTRAVALSFESRLPLRYSPQPDASLASALNHAVSLARGEVVLFLDDGDIADPRLLDAHVDGHRRLREREIAVLGHTGLAPTLEADPVMHFAVDVARLMFAYAGVEAGDVLDFTDFRGGRFSCKRSMLSENGSFEAAAGSGCEDVELAFRLSKRGLTFVYAPDAVTTTVRRLSFDDLCRRMELEGSSRFLFSQLHGDAVQRRTEVSDALGTWQRLGPGYELLKKAGRELDRIARLRLEAGIGMNAADVGLLYGGYWTAFRTSRAKGIVESAATASVSGAR